MKKHTYIYRYIVSVAITLITLESTYKIHERLGYASFNGIGFGTSKIDFKSKSNSKSKILFKNSSNPNPLYFRFEIVTFTILLLSPHK